MVWRRGTREIIYLSLHCHHQNDICIKMGSDESHFNVSVGCDEHLSEEKGEPKRYRTEVLPLTSLTTRPNRLTIASSSSTLFEKSKALSLFRLPPSRRISEWTRQVLNGSSIALHVKFSKVAYKRIVLISDNKIKTIT